MSKDDLLSDFKHIYPGLSREEVEKLLTLLDQSASTEASMGLSIATAIKPIVPEVAGRIESYSAGDVDEYVRMLRGAVVLLLRSGNPTANLRQPMTSPTGSRR